LPNRRYFDQQLPVEWQRTIRARHSFSILFIDIDHFKRYNDFYGHQNGDRCLQLVAEKLEGELKRAGDVIVRYGGEEFVCLLPSTDTAGSAKLAQNLIDAITRTAIPHADSPVAAIISISIGVASTNPQSGDNVIELIQCADEMLYLAKEQGRNRIATITLENKKKPVISPL
jgi:diguanylate cyclase (GGDEF)-like protein